MALFTGKGDGGTTKVLDSKERIPKFSELPEALGSLDELNSFIGLARIHTERQDMVITSTTGKQSLSEILHSVQESLFVVQAETAGADKSIKDGRVAWMEDIIHAIEKEIPPITSFTIAGGTECAAILDVARTLVRRAERRLSAVEHVGARVFSPHTKAFMNRLSSLLFALARVVNFRAGVAEQSPTYQ